MPNWRFATTPGGPAADRPLQLFESVAQPIGHLAAPQPLLLVLEDLHWADEMSVRLLAFVGRRLADWPVLIVVTAREEELADAPVLRNVLEELEREDRMTRVPLGPLSQRRHADARSPARADRQRRGGAGAARRAGLDRQRGQPLRGRGDRAGAAEGRPRAGLGLPERVREIVAAALERVSQRARRSRPWPR